MGWWLLATTALVGAAAAAVHLSRALESGLDNNLKDRSAAASEAAVAVSDLQAASTALRTRVVESARPTVSPPAG